MKMRIIIITGFVMSLFGTILTLGCTSDYHLADRQTWNSRLVMELWTTDEALEAGETLGIRATVKNVTNDEIEYTTWNVGDPPIYIRVTPPYGEPIEQLPAVGLHTSSPMVRIDELGGTDKIKRTVKWESSQAAVNGTYKIEARFYPGDQTGLPVAEPILVTQSLEMADGLDVIGQDAVEAKVEDLFSVRLWKRAHTGTAVARAVKDGYFVNQSGEWQSVNEDTYEEAAQMGRHPTWRLTDESPKQWIAQYHSKYGFEPLELTVTVDAQTNEIESVSPDLAAELEGGIVATFEVQDSLFRVFVTNPDTIDSLFALQRGESSSSIPNGPLLAGPGAGLHNAPWSWHLDPEGISMADFTIEVCDGTPEFVESDLDYWLDTVGQYCPWSAELVKIDDYR